MITFETSAEVQTVRIAFQEPNNHLRSLGNDNSVSPYQERITKWQGAPQIFRGPHHKVLVDKLQYLVDTTDESVDALLDETDNPNRIARSATRYKLGHRALCLVESIKLHADMEADWSRVLDEDS